MTDPSINRKELLTIKFDAVVGDVREKVTITQYLGYHQGGYSVNINNFHQGHLLFRQGTWVFFGNERSKVMPEDVAILGEIVDEYRKEHPEAG